VLKRIDFSNDANRLCKFVEEVKGTGGGDEPECYELVLHDAQSLSWTKEEEEKDAAGKDTKKTETMKALVIIGDEEPHEKQDLKGKVEYDWREELAALKAQGIYVYGVQCAKNKNADEFYRTLGEVSGGSHLRLNAIKEMERLIKGLCYRQATDFMAASSEQSTADAAGGQQGEPLSLHPTLEAIHNAVHTPDQVPPLLSHSGLHSFVACVLTCLMAVRSCSENDHGRWRRARAVDDGQCWLQVRADRGNHVHRTEQEEGHHLRGDGESGEPIIHLN
jgi:hypothetical protein